MNQSLALKISTGNLLKFALPTILSSIFMNIYSTIDSLFVSNLLGTDALSAVNIAAPFLAIALAIGVMISTGGSALVAKQLGEGKERSAKENFSFFMLLTVVISTVFAVIGLIFRNPILHAMGANDVLYPMSEAYAIPLFLIIPFAMTGIIVQTFLVACGKPGLAFGLSFIGGILNIVLDYVFIAVVNLGVAGAALASGIGYSIEAIVGVIYFIVKRNGVLCFVKPKANFHVILQACSNGMSEMVGTLAVSVTMIAMNVILMKISGSDGVAAVAIILSVQTILSAAYMGYATGIAPIISFNYGKQDTDNLKKIYKIGLKTIALISVVTFISVFPVARPLARLYAEGSEPVIKMAIEGIEVFAVAFLIMGFNLFASSMFTALNDGKTSAILSLFRTLIFLIVPLFILPPIFGVWGVWISMPLAEIFSLMLSWFYLKKNKTTYQYA